MAHHHRALCGTGFDKYIANQISVAYKKADISEADIAMLDYAEKLTLSPAACFETDVEHLRKAGFEDDQILLINLTASYFNFVNRLAQGLGVTLEMDNTAECRS